MRDPATRRPSTTRGPKWRLTAITFFFFFAAYYVRLLLFQFPSFEAFYRSHPWQVGETIWKGLWILLAFIGIMIAYRARPGWALRELGLGHTPGFAIVAAFVATLPMLVGFALTFSTRPSISFLPIWMTGVASPVAEEVLFRGYLFRQLYQRAGWPFWAAVLANVLPFAIGHMGQAGELRSGVMELLPILLVTGAAAALLAWLLVRWNYNLWFIIVAHALMNLWWYLFAVDDTAVGGWVANAARLLTIVAAVIITFRRDWIFRRIVARAAA